MNANEDVVLVLDGDEEDEGDVRRRRRRDPVVFEDTQPPPPPSDVVVLEDTQPPPPPSDVVVLVEDSAREAVAPRNDDDPSFTLSDLSNDLLVSIFAMTRDHRWVRATFPRVCKEWAALYRTRHASPLHAVLSVDAGVAGAERVLEWARRHSLDVRRLRVADRRRPPEGARPSFDAATVGALVRTLGDTLEEISVAGGCERLVDQHFWQALRDSVAGGGETATADAAETTTTTTKPLRSLVLRSLGTVDPERDLGPLRSLSNALEELVLCSGTRRDVGGLGSFPTQLFSLTSLMRLELSRALASSLPPSISCLRGLEELAVRECRLSALPEALTTLKKLTRLELEGNRGLGAARVAPTAEARAAAEPPPPAFPEALGRLSRLRHLGLRSCGLSAVPDLVSRLESLRSLSLGGRDVLVFGRERPFPRLSALTRLDLSRSGTRLIQLPRGISSLHSLRDLDVSHCSLISLSSELGALTRLTKLDLSNNVALGASLLLRRRSPSPSPAPPPSRRRTALAAAAGELPSSSRPSTFRGLVSLRHLVLRRCGLSAVPSRALRGLDLKFLDLSGNAGIGGGGGSPYGAPLRSDDGDAPLPSLPHLRRLDLSNCDLSSLPSATALGLLTPSLWFLYLHNNVLNDLPANLGKSLRELRGVLLSGNRYRRPPLAALSGARLLDSVDVDNNFPLQFDDEESKKALGEALRSFPALRLLSARKADARCRRFQPSEESRRNLTLFAERLRAREPSARVEF